MKGIGNWLRRIEAQLDEWGRGAWIATVVAAFILFGPLGLIVLGYALWSKKMSSSNWKPRRTHRETGNTAFDAYRKETLERLEQERTAFVDFLARLREAKDRSEFEQFMGERGGEAKA